MTLVEFIAALNEKFASMGYHFDYMAGAKYARVTRGDVHNGEVTGKSAYCFIDGDGNIYKAASWKAPAKGVRSTLATVDIGFVDPYGGWLYR